MTDFAWLIEAPGAHYLGVRKALGDYRSEFYWTHDPHKALRLISKDAADGVAMAVRKLAPELWGFAGTLGEAWPREHGWLSANGASPRSDAVSQEDKS